MVFVRLILALGILLLCGLAPAFCSKRVALVMGNHAYRDTPPLANPVNDAYAMAAVLQGLGFTVILGIDLGKADMDAKIRAFVTLLPGAEVAVFFYSGHGLQSGNVNYLVPVDAKAASIATLDSEMVRLQDVQQSMEREAKISILFLDACRDSSPGRSSARARDAYQGGIGQGLAPMGSNATGTVISFSTEPGNVALDGTGNNSPYTTALVRRIGTPGEEVMSMLMEVRKEVRAATGGRQTTWEHSALVDKFYFKPASLPAFAIRVPPFGSEVASIEQIGSMRTGH